MSAARRCCTLLAAIGTGAVLAQTTAPAGPASGRFDLSVNGAPAAQVFMQIGAGSTGS